MFATVVLALFAFSISRIEIQCSIIRLESPVAEAKDSMELTKNLTLLKKTEDIVIQSKSAPFSQGRNKNINTLIGKTKPHVHRDRKDEENRFLTSSRKDRRAKDDVGNRKPKFFGPLDFLTAFSVAHLATAASANANAFAKLFNAAVPVPIAAPSYFTGFYEPQHYLPFSYPVLYPVSRPANGYQNFVSRIPVTPSSLLQQNSNITTEKSPQKNDTNSGTNDEANELANEKAQKGRDDAASRADVDDNGNEETELRQSKLKTTTTSTTTTTTTTTAKPLIVKTTVAPNVTEPTPSPTNATGSYLPFYGYYGGSPQDLGHVIFTTEDPQLRYLKDYTTDTFSVPFERPAAFSPYQNADSYQSSFGNSYSPGGPFTEFLNTIESDRYVYDSENRRNFNGFRPILK